jgi:hypothetical protein
MWKVPENVKNLVCSVGLVKHRSEVIKGSGSYLRVATLKF